MTGACNIASHVPMWAAGYTAALADVPLTEAELLPDWMAKQPFGAADDDWTPVALMLLELAREPAGQPEAQNGARGGL